MRYRPKYFVVFSIEIISMPLMSHRILIKYWHCWELDKLHSDIYKFSPRWPECTWAVKDSCRQARDANAQHPCHILQGHCIFFPDYWTWYNAPRLSLTQSGTQSKTCSQMLAVIEGMFLTARPLVWLPGVLDFRVVDAYRHRSLGARAIFCDVVSSHSGRSSCSLCLCTSTSHFRDDL